MLKDDDRAVMPDAMSKAIERSVSQVRLLLDEMFKVRREAIYDLFIRTSRRATRRRDFRCRLPVRSCRRFHAMTQAHTGSQACQISSVLDEAGRFCRAETSRLLNLMNWSYAVLRFAKKRIGYPDATPRLVAGLRGDL